MRRGNGRRASAAAKAAEFSSLSLTTTSSDSERRKQRNKKFTKYDGTSMEERHLIQEERTRKKMAEIEGRKRQQEEVP